MNHLAFELKNEQSNPIILTVKYSLANLKYILFLPSSTWRTLCSSIGSYKGSMCWYQEGLMVSQGSQAVTEDRCYTASIKKYTSAGNSKKLFLYKQNYSHRELFILICSKLVWQSGAIPSNCLKIHEWMHIGND